MAETQLTIPFKQKIMEWLREKARGCLHIRQEGEGDILGMCYRDPNEAIGTCKLLTAANPHVCYDGCDEVGVAGRVR